jgi:hypothetical protein
LNRFIQIPILFAALLCSTALYSQTRFSLGTDLGLQRNFKKEQQYWAVGHTIHTHFHITPKNGLYAWLSYYSNGKFKNELTSTAKSALTIPQQISYTNNATMSFRHFSMGWKHYFKGRFDTEAGYNLYGYAGFGLLFGRIENTHSVSIDTNNYYLPARAGSAKFKRLTFDLGLGWEAPIGGDLFVYMEGRFWVPASDYPSKYLFVNKNAPLAGMLNAGVRILFD